MIQFSEITAKRKKIAQKYGLNDSCQIIRLFLTSSQKEELMRHVYFMDGTTFMKISKSNYFYLIESHQLKFELFCCVEKPKIPICVEMLNERRFIPVRIEQRHLVKFLDQLIPLKVVESHAKQ